MKKQWGPLWSEGLVGGRLGEQVFSFQFSVFSFQFSGLRAQGSGLLIFLSFPIRVIRLIRGSQSSHFLIFRQLPPSFMRPMRERRAL